MKYGDGKQKPAGTWDFFGSCSPDRPNLSYCQLTFSLGIFKWIQKKSGSGTKRGKVSERVYGFVSTPQDTFDRALKIVEGKNKVSK